MVRIVSSSLALLISSWSVIAAAQNAAPAPAPAPAPRAPGAAPAAQPAQPAPGTQIPTTLTPTSAAGAVGPEAPVGKVTLSLEKRLQDMMKGNGLTAEQVATKAVAVSPQVEAKRRSVQAADAGVEQSQLAFLPALTLSARYTRLSKLNYPAGSGFSLVGSTAPNADGTVPPDSLVAFSTRQLSPQILNQYAFQASLTVPLSDYLLRMSYAVDASKRSKSAAQIDEQATKLAVARDARVAYYNWIFAQGAAYVGQQGLEQAQGHLNDAKNSWTAGVLSKADVLRAESAAKAAELFAEQTKNSVLIATERLRVIMHEQEAVNHDIGENILADLPPLENAVDFEKAYSEAVSKRLELRVLAENEAGLNEQVTAVEAARYPRLDATANALLANPNQRYFPATDSFKPTWDVGVVLSWTPTGWFATSAAAKVVEARAAELAAQRQNLRDGLRMEVNQAIIAAREAEFALTSTRQALAASEESYRARRELFRAGKSTMVEVTDAETNLTRARLDVVNAHISVRITRVQLEHALGRDVTAKQ